MILGRGPKKTKKELMDILNMITGDTSSIISGITIEDDSVTAITANKVSIGLGFKAMVKGIPGDWGWLKLKVVDSLRNRLDSLTDGQKVELYKKMDKSIKEWNGEIKKGPIIRLAREDKTTKFATFKISSEAIARWKEMPTIKKGNTFSRTSWAINNVVLPFLNTLT